MITLLARLDAAIDDDTDRAIFDQHAPVVDGTQNSWAWFQGSESESEAILRDLALKYSVISERPKPASGSLGV